MRRDRIAKAAALALVVSPVAAATATDTAVGFSHDGVEFGSTLAQPLFDPALRWVPGDVREATLYVKNQSPNTAVLSFRGAGQLAPADRSEGLVIAFDPAESTEPVAPDEVVPVTVRVSYLPTSTESLEGWIGDVVLEAVLTDESGVAGRTVTLDDSDSGNGSATTKALNALLPDTGAQATVSLLLLALGSIAAGLAVLLARRRHTTEGSAHVSTHRK